jgi:hypothetical protein
MKKNDLLLSLIFLMFLSFLFMLGCKKKEAPNMIPDPVLTNDYQGQLYVRYTSTLPPWDVSTTMNVHIAKDLGVVTIDGGTLSYSGDTIINGDSRLVRSGEWAMNPNGILMEDAGRKYIDVDAQVTVQNDIQRIYAKDNDGNWVLVNETPFNETPYSVVSFDFDDAETNGSYQSLVVATGSIIWRLTLTPVP